MCDKAMGAEPGSLEYVPDRFKSQKMCDAALMEDPCPLEFFPDYL